MSTLIPTAVMATDAEGIHVTIEWSGAKLDRPNTGGWGLGAQHGKLAERLVRCINAGKATGTPTIATDVNGKTYVSAPHKVFGRTMNADLKRLGF